MKKGAIISDCGKYRYRLWRIWNEANPLVMFIMLNPSTADSNLDDPTIRRCIGFAGSWGYGGLYVGNLFAYRSTDPKQLKSVIDPRGKDNDYHLRQMVMKCSIVICAWGNGYEYPNDSICGIPESLMHYIDLSKDGIPKHPLYLKKSLKPKRFDKSKL